MKLSHKINHGWMPGRVDNDNGWAERVEREATQQSQQHARAYEKAQERLARAEQRLERVRNRAGVQSSTRAIAAAEAFVEQQRQELLAIDALMKASPASAAHRGRKSFRPVPYSEGRGGL